LNFVPITSKNSACRGKEHKIRYTVEGRPQTGGGEVATQRKR
jgi:hypothetical protein